MELTKDELRKLREVWSLEVRKSAKSLKLRSPAELAGVTDWWREVGLPLESKLLLMELEAGKGAAQ